MSDETTLSLALGSVGSFLMLLAYTLVGFHRDLGACGHYFTETALPYLLMNAVGGSLACAGGAIAGSAGAYPLAALEGAWAVVAVIGLIKRGVECRKQSTTAAAAAGVVSYSTFERNSQ